MHYVRNILHRLTVYNPQAITALMVFLQGPRNVLRKLALFSFNSLYYSGRLLKRWRHRKKWSVSRRFSTMQFPEAEQKIDIGLS